METQSHHAKSYPIVRSLESGLRILALFEEDPRERSVAEIGKALEIPLGSAYRIVHTLLLGGFLERSRPYGPVRLGLRLMRLGWRVQSGLDVREIALPIMKRLAVDDVGETAVLMVPREQYAVCVENVEGSYPIRPRSISVGERRPYNAGAIAIALLAFTSEEHRERILSASLESATESTVIDPSQLRARCASVRERGVAYSRGEVIAGTAAVASPILRGDGELIAALGLTGIEERIVGLDEKIKEAAQEIGASFGSG